MSATYFDVVVVGNIGIDTNVYLPGADIDFFREGNFTQNIDYIGQAGGYASRGYAHLGAKTAFIGCVGDDYSGRFIRETLAADDINTDGLFIDPTGTSRSVNIMYKDGRRRNFYDGKDHMHLSAPLAVSESLFTGARLAHFNIPNWARHLLPLAKAKGVSIAVDLQDMNDLNDPYRQDFIEYADYLFFSAANQSDPRRILAALLQRKPSLTVISGLGAQGCLLGTQAEGIRQYPPFQMDLPVIDTNGAGDSLAVGFLLSHVLKDRSLEDSILRGQIGARYCCTQKASTDHLLTRELLDQYLNAAR